MSRGRQSLICSRLIPQSDKKSNHSSLSLSVRHMSPGQPSYDWLNHHVEVLPAVEVGYVSGFQKSLPTRVSLPS